MMHRLFHANVDIDTIQRSPAKPAHRSRSADGASSADNSLERVAPATSRALAQYVPMTLPTVTYDAFLHSAIASDLTHGDGGLEIRHKDHHTDAHRPRSLLDPLIKTGSSGTRRSMTRVPLLFQRTAADDAPAGGRGSPSLANPVLFTRDSRHRADRSSGALHPSAVSSRPSSAGQPLESTTTMIPVPRRAALTSSTSVPAPQSLNASFSSQRSDSPARQQAMRELHSNRRRSPGPAPTRSHETHNATARSASVTSTQASTTWLNHHVDPNDPYVRLARLLTPVVTSLRRKAKFYTGFGHSMLVKITETQRFLRELAEGVDHPFTAAQLRAEMHHAQQQLSKYLVNDTVVAPISFKRLKKRFAASGAVGSVAAAATKPATVRRPRVAPPATQEPAPAADGDLASPPRRDDADTRTATPVDSDTQGAAYDAPAPSAVAAPRRFKILKRGEGLKRFYGTDAPVKPGEVHHADKAPALNAFDAEHHDPTGAERIAALAMPKRTTEKLAQPSARSASAGSAAPRRSNSGPRPAAQRASSVDHATGDHSSSPSHGGRRVGASPSRDAVAAPPHPQLPRSLPLGAASSMHPSSPAASKTQHRKAAGEMAAVLAPELVALLMPTPYHAWTVEECLRRPAGYRSVVGALPTPQAARDILSQFTRSGRDFNRLIDNLTSLL